jgi:hypothetical protein
MSDNDKMVKLATYGSLEEAYLARNLLENEGVKAIAVEETNGGLWQLNPLVGGAGDYVVEEDAERARKALERDGSEDTIEDNPSPHVTVRPADTEEVVTQVTAEPPDVVASEEVMSAGPEEEEEEAAPASDSAAGDVMAARGFRSAVLGVIAFSLAYARAGGAIPAVWIPGFDPILRGVGIGIWIIFSGYSLYMLFQLGRWNGELSSTGSRNLWLAFAFNAISIGLFAVWFSMAFGRA